jgi:ABC-type cobalamin/Fe3+-siderophores transport system ATPase subunit
VPFNLTIPRRDNQPFEYTVNAGEVLFVLGANGTGKSSLMLHFYRSHAGNAKRISAHRQNWFESNTLAMSAIDRRNVGNNVRAWDTQVNSRWMEQQPAARSSMAIFDLMDAENVRARNITEAVDNDDFLLAKSLSKKDAPIKVINELLRLSNIPIVISVREREEINAIKDGGNPFSIAQLSDGERNALLIAANVLTATDGTLILIDEPERHLHRSIISPLLSNLFSIRSECAFVISTHDVMLPLDNPESKTLLVRGCTFNGTDVSNWDIDLVPSDQDIDDELKRDILGARRKILFVEGTEKSLDKPLYSLIFNNTSVISKESCRDVENAASGIRDAAELHWLRAFGVVDGDGRDAADVARLATKGVYCISSYSVESIYYHPDIQQLIAVRQAGLTGGDAPTLLDRAKTAAIGAIQPHVDRMSLRVAEKEVRERFLQKIPAQDAISTATGPVGVTVDVPPLLEAERNRLRRALEAGNLTESRT